MSTQKHPLAAYRARTFTTQVDLAKRVGVSHVTIGKIERYDFLPSLETVAKLIAITGLSADDFLPKKKGRKRA